MILEGSYGHRERFTLHTCFHNYPTALDLHFMYPRWKDRAVTSKQRTGRTRSTRPSRYRSIVSAELLLFICN